MREEGFITPAEEKAAGNLSPEGAMHTLSAVHRSHEVAPLLDHPTTFPLVWSILGWNVHVYHSHLDVHPPLTEAMDSFRAVFDLD